MLQLSPVCVGLRNPRGGVSLLAPYLNRKILKFSDIGYKTPWNHSIIIFLSQISGHILLLCYSFYYIS